MFSNRNGLIVDYNAVLWALMGKTARKLSLIQKCPQFYQKLSASIACMLATFSMSALITRNLVSGIIETIDYRTIENKE